MDPCGKIHSEVGELDFGAVSESLPVTSVTTCVDEHGQYLI